MSSRLSCKVDTASGIALRKSWDCFGIDIRSIFFMTIF